MGGGGVMAGRYAAGSPALYMRQHRAIKRTLGLCKNCAAKALLGRRTCAKHRRRPAYAAA